MFSFSFWVYLLIVWLNLKFAISINRRTIEGRIIHGKNASILQNAHAVLIQMISSDIDMESHTCGASVLNQKFLLTAAHCLNFKGKFKTIAFAGHEDIRKSPVKRIASTTIVHKKFKVASTVENDIALVVLNKELPLGARIKRTIIKRSFPRDVTGTLAGWGLVNEETEEGTYLLKFLTQEVRNKQCKKLVDSSPGMFCAGSLKSSNPSPSLGDSGSGLLTKKIQIIGILSYKTSKYPALPVYTNVSHFYQWIIENTHRIYCKER